MKRWWLIFALILSLGVNLGILATLALRRPEPAAPPSEGPPPRTLDGWQRGSGPEGPPFEEGHPGAMLRRLVERLGLEGEQRQRFVAIHREFFERQGGLRRQLMEVQRTLREEVMAADPDPEQLKALLTRMHKLQLERDQLWIQSILASRETLTPEQEQEYQRFLMYVTRRAFEDRMRGGPPPGRRGPRQP